MQISQRKLKDWLLHRTQVCFNLCFHLHYTDSAIAQKFLNSNYEEKQF